MGDRTRGLRRVRVRRDSGVSRGTHLLIGSFSPMGDDDTALWGGELSSSKTGYYAKWWPVVRFFGKCEGGVTSGHSQD